MDQRYLVWLAAHPQRSAAWLRAKLRDGFDVIHDDGDSTNEAPENLILVESKDAMLYHRNTIGRSAPESAKDESEGTA